MSVVSQILHNNIILIAEPIEAVKTTSIGFWFSVGSRFEPQNMRGITHFVEHLIFKGTQSHSAYNIASSFDVIGGYVNAFTERENVCIHCVVPAIHTQKALSLLLDMSENALFSETDILNERVVIESEIISSLDDCEEAALDAVTATVWPDNAISSSIAGSVDDVRNLNRKMLFEWYQKYFVQGELSVCIAGNINNLDVANILNSGGFHKPSSSRIQQKSDLPFWKNGLTFLSADFQQEQFFVLFPVAYHINEEDYYRKAVINAIIGDTMSSRLFQRLRENGGYCYNVYSFFSFYTDTGCWCAYAASSKDSSIKIVTDLQDELYKLFQDGVSDYEVEAAKEHLCGEELISSEDIEYRMKQLSKNFSLGFSFRSTDQIINIIHSIGVDELHEGIKQLLNFSKQATIVYGPKLCKKQKEAIKKLF